MAPHEQRVVDEKEAIWDKIVKLDAFIATNSTYESLAEDDKLLLVNQLEAMREYESILSQRIQRFK